MSTFSLPEAVHVCLGGQELDFPEGTVTAADPDQERALDHLVVLEKATVLTVSSPPAPAVEELPAEDAPPKPPAPPPAPPEDHPPGTAPDAAGIGAGHEEV